MRRRRAGLKPALVVIAVIAVIAAACSREPDRLTTSDRIGGDVDTRCDWPTAGASLARLATSRCEESITAGSVERMKEMFFLPTRQEVTGAPAVDAESLYFGDWSGRVYAASRSDGAVRWTFDAEVGPVYAGQITATPALTTVGARDAVVVASAHTIYALARDDGSVLWRHRIEPPDERPTEPGRTKVVEVEGAPAVTGDLVIVGFDVHDDPTQRAGVLAVDRNTGERRWYWDPEEGLPAGGCGDVWGAPAVDEKAGRVIVGTANCSKPASWGKYAEAIVSLDLKTGEPQWSFQPHEKGNNQDWDFAGAPNLYEIDGRPVVGLGNKDGWYYVVDRRNGKLVWKVEAQRQDSDGDGFAFGGFIGATAVSGSVVTGGTAIGDCPCMHAFDAATGKVRWKSDEPSGTYASAAATSDLVFLGGVDQTLRAFRLSDGKVVWSKPLRAVTSSGAAIAGRDLYVGVGFREPGTDTPSAAAGVHAFRVLAPGEKPPESTTSTLPDTGPPVTALTPGSDRCIAEACALPTELKEPPPGTNPKVSLQIQPDPLKITLTAEGLGPPSGWVRPGSAASKVGATVYGLFISSRDDQPQLGSVICTFTEDQNGCTGTTIARRADRYTRLTLVAFADASTPPTLQDGIDRFVTTQAFEPPLITKG